MKIKNFCAGLLVATGVFTGEASRAQYAITELLKTKPAAAPKGKTNIISDYKHSYFRGYELTLVNGIHVVIRADDARKDILMSATAPGGASLVDDQDFESAMHAGDIIGNSALGDYSREEINQFFRQKNMMLTPGIDEKYATLKGSFSHQDLETFLQAITLYFTQPRADQAYFDTYIKNLEASVAARNKNSYAVFQDSVVVWTASNKNRVNRLSVSQIRQISLDKADEAYRKCFGNAHGFTFVFTGNFGKVDDMNKPAEEDFDMIGRYLGALPAMRDSTGIIDRNMDIPQGKIMKTVHNGNAPLSAVQLIYSGNYHHADSVDLQLKVLSYLLEKNMDTLTSFKGAGGASVKLTLNKFPKETYEVAIAFKCPPAQVDKRIAAVHQVIAQLQHGVKPEEIKQYVAMRKRELRIQLFDSVYWRDYLALQYRNHDDPYDIIRYPYNFYRADEHTAQQAANQFLTDKNYLQAVLLPAKGK